MWNADRGYGFISNDDGGPDMFLHISALQAAGIDPDNIRKGERLTFEVESTREGRQRSPSGLKGEARKDIVSDGAKTKTGWLVLCGRSSPTGARQVFGVA